MRSRFRAWLLLLPCACSGASAAEPAKDPVPRTLPFCEVGAKADLTLEVAMALPPTRRFIAVSGYLVRHERGRTQMGCAAVDPNWNCNTSIYGAGLATSRRGGGVIELGAKDHRMSTCTDRGSPPSCAWGPRGQHVIARGILGGSSMIDAEVCELRE